MCVHVWTYKYYSRISLSVGNQSFAAIPHTPPAARDFPPPPLLRMGCMGSQVLAACSAPVACQAWIAVGRGPSKFALGPLPLSPVPRLGPSKYRMICIIQCELEFLRLYPARFKRARSLPALLFLVFPYLPATLGGRCSAIEGGKGLVTGNCHIGR